MLFCEKKKRYLLSPAIGVRMIVKIQMKWGCRDWICLSVCFYQVFVLLLKGTISDPKSQTSLVSEPSDFFAYSERISL